MKLRIARKLLRKEMSFNRYRGSTMLRACERVSKLGQDRDWHIGNLHDAPTKRCECEPGPGGHARICKQARREN